MIYSIIKKMHIAPNIAIMSGSRDGDSCENRQMNPKHEARSRSRYRQ